jgi:hypothetical protein
VRIQWFDASATEVSMPAGRFAPARWYAEQKDLPKFSNDVAPRLSAAYDVFGDGRTALKASASRSYQQHTGFWTKRYANSGQSTDNRNWFDCAINAAGNACSGVALPTNNDRIVQDNEIGPTSSTTFGLRSDRNPAPDIQRVNNWEYTAAVQHQLFASTSVSFGWYHRSWRELEVSDRTRITKADYTAFTVKMPYFANDPTLEGVLDPNEMLTIYNLNPAKRSVFSSAIVDDNSNDQSVYNGFETSFNTRFRGGIIVFGGWTMDRNVAVYCTLDDNPNGVSTADLYLGEAIHNGGRFCDQRNLDVPFKHEIKLAGNLPLPYGLDFAAALQSYSGLERTITWTPPPAIFPGGRTNPETIILTPKGATSYPRYNQLDVNLKKTFRSGQKTFTVQADVFNVLNSNTIMGTNNAIGANLGFVNEIQIGRLPRIAFQMKF